MPSCAFLSIEQTDGWFIDDDLVHPYLKELGWQIQNVPWTAKIDWNQFDVVVIRSPWDYQDHLEAFLKVLQQIESSSAMLLNPFSTVSWNVNKRYLFELEKKGVQLVPTERVKSPSIEELAILYDRFETDELIIKPMIGANADDTFRLPKSNLPELKPIIDRFSDRSAMIQPFMQSVVEEGEFSLIYFNGHLSHTILKTVAAGDYRVQEEHGGGVISIPTPESALLQAAEKAMNSLPFKPFYARVDLVRAPQNTFNLMELELIEPCLYFRFDEESPKRFAQIIDQMFS